MCGSSIWCHCGGSGRLQLGWIRGTGPVAFGLLHVRHQRLFLADNARRGVCFPELYCELPAQGEDSHTLTRNGILLRRYLFEDIVVSLVLSIGATDAGQPRVSEGAWAPTLHRHLVDFSSEHVRFPAALTSRATRNTAGSDMEPYADSDTTQVFPDSAHSDDTEILVNSDDTKILAHSDDTEIYMDGDNNDDLDPVAWLDGVSKPKENGTSNGHHSSSKHHSSSSKHHSSSSKHHSSSSSKHHSSSSKHHSSSSGDKKHHSSSSSSKHHSSSSSKHGSGDHKHSSSRHSSGDKKHSSSSSGDKKHHSSSKHKHSSSSSGDKKHSSSSSSKHHSSSSSKHRESSESKPTVKVDVEEPKPVVKYEPPPSPIKEEPEYESEPEPEYESKIEAKYEPVNDEPEDEPMDESDDDVPLIARAPKVESKYREYSDDEDDVPLTTRAPEMKKAKAESKPKKRKSKDVDDYDDYDDYEEVPKKKKKSKAPPVTQQSPTKKSIKTAKMKKEEEEKWRWWEEERKDDGTKWHFLEHKGPVFAPAYERLPEDVRFYYDGKAMVLSEEAEEVMTFYGRMIDHDYTTMEVFNKNFFKDWRATMTSHERDRIKDLTKCNFKEVDAHFKRKSEERKAMSKEEKNKIKEENARLVEEYGFCMMDSHKEKIGNFRIEPPGLFRGRGSHPKMGTYKKRVMPEEIIINCSKDSKIPQPPPGHKWKEVRCDNTVTWLASWTENVQGGTKYIMLNPASRLKGEKDWMKYETARKLHKVVDKIRATYREDWKVKEMRIRQRSVALYFIDKLALRAGNEKDEETADTVGCCSLRVEHLSLHEEMDGKDYVVEFDFLGKDSIRYYNKVAVEKRVFKNLQLFMENKAPGDDLFDRLNTTIMNKHLQQLMDGLTAKVFRTYNASRTLQEQLDLLTEPDDPIPAKFLSYNRANRAVAVLCNHQRAVPKNFSKQMENIQAKIDAKKDVIHTAKKDLKTAKADFKANKTEKAKQLVDKRKKAVARLEEQFTKLEVQMTDKDENKDIALGTSKLNYLDPRISAAWCKKWEVPIEKIYNKTQRDKFAWAIDMADETYVF